MKKIFSFVIVAFAAIALNAADVIFDFTNPASLGIEAPEAGEGVQIAGQSYTVGDVTITFATQAGDGVKEWNSGGNLDLRVYQKNSFKITSNGANISKVQFSFSEKGGLVPATGEIDATGAWLGDAKEVTFNNPEKGKGSKIKTITVYTGEAPIVKIDTLNVGEMNAEIVKAGGKLSKQVCVIGRVSGIDKSGVATYGNINVWLADIRSEYATDTIEAYRMKSFNGENYSDIEDIQFGIGDTIVFYAGEWSYYKDKDINEGVSGYLVKVIGGGNPEPIVINEITVEEALVIGGALAAGTKTTDKYDVRGYVASISSTKGLEKIYLADDPDAYGAFVAYQCEIADGADVYERDLVSVVGYIEKFQYQGAAPDDYTIEISKGKLTVLEHTALPTVIAEKVSCKKMMINGQMYIKKGKKLYSVLGQAL